MIDILMNGYEYYRIMLLELLDEKNIGNCEFAINLLDNPILRVDGDRLKNPFSDSLGKLAKDIEITGNVIPVLGKNSFEGFLDVSIPSPIDWYLTSKEMVLPNTNLLGSNNHHHLLEYVSSTRDQNTGKGYTLLINPDSKKRIEDEEF